jgi:EAL domain-containing protein (putative c-di-GMP-specific phosphodiesterase class I)
MSVMEQALKVAKSWTGDLTLAVNISPVQFKDPLLAQRITKLLVETGFPAARLELEITESALLDDEELAVATVHSLKNQGIRISLDDFGTGYASLTQLRSLPFDRIKIDRSFVAALMSDPQSGAIVSTIAGLGKLLHLPVTAEGVESVEIRDRLQALGCSDAQGWYFGKAVPAGEVADMVQRHELVTAPDSLHAIELSIPGGERRDLRRRPAKRRKAA